MANNDSRSVGRPSNSPGRMEPRSVPVQHDKARINDQRKVRPHSPGKPPMGNLPSGGAQKPLKKPALNKAYMGMRDVPVKTVTEMEWPWQRRSTLLPDQSAPGDVLAWHRSNNGEISVLHIRDGQLVDQSVVFSRDKLAQQMQDAGQQYWDAKQNQQSLRWKPREAGRAAAEQYAREHGITPTKIGEYGREIAPPVGRAGAPGAAAPAPEPAAGPEMGAPEAEMAPQMAPQPGGMPNPGNSPVEKLRVLKHFNPRKYRSIMPQDVDMIERSWKNALKVEPGLVDMLGEGYPDTNFERDEPAHESRIGDLGWDGYPEEASPPALNRDFAQFRDLPVEKIHEMAEAEISNLVRRTAARLGFKDLVIEEDEPLPLPAPTMQHSAIPRTRYRWFGEADEILSEFHRSLPKPKRPLPPNIAGSGKNFHVKPGTNNARKQPGNLAGSGKAMKVKPGFIG